jgi:hypothetical protein
MSTGIMVNGTDLANIFGAKGASTAAATGIKVNGTDLNQLLLAKADGQAISYATGIKVNGTDLNAIFGAPITSLPINGQTFTSQPTFAGGISTSNLYFNTNNATWSVTGSYSNTSGSIPSGATQCRVTVTYVSGNTGGSVTNPFSSMTALSSTTQSANVHLTSSQSSPVNATYSVKIEYANSSGTVISTTNCTFYMNTAAS